MLGIFQLLTELLLWTATPLIFLLILRFYHKETMAYRVIVATVLSVISLLILYVTRAFLLAEAMTRFNPF